jgi:hypothetical protein
MIINFSCHLFFPLTHLLVQGILITSMKRMPHLNITFLLPPFHPYDVIIPNFKLHGYLLPLTFVLLCLFTFSYFFATMVIDSASSFNIIPEGKSWADIVEEDEEYNRLHPDQDSSDELDQTLETSGLVDNAHQKEGSTLLKKEIQGKREHLSASTAEETTVKQHEIEENALKMKDEVKLKVEEGPKVEELMIKRLPKTEEDSKVGKSMIEEPKVEEAKDEEAKTKSKVEESKVEEPKIEKPKVEEPNDEKSKVESPKLTGAMASKWATAPSDPPRSPRKQQSPRVVNAEVSSSTDSFKNGAMVSKWASVPDEPPTRSYRRYDSNNRYGSNDKHNSGSRYSSNDRYGNNDRYGTNSGRWSHDRYQENEARPSGGRLNRDYFEEKRQSRGTFESRLNRADFEKPQSHYSDNNDGRKGGFDNKENFSKVNRYQDYIQRTEPEDISNTPNVQEAVKAWNAYKAPEDNEEADKKG